MSEVQDFNVRPIFRTQSSPPGNGSQSHAPGQGFAGGAPKSASAASYGRPLAETRAFCWSASGPIRATGGSGRVGSSSNGSPPSTFHSGDGWSPRLGCGESTGRPGASGRPAPNLGCWLRRPGTGEPDHNADRLGADKPPQMDQVYGCPPTASRHPGSVLQQDVSSLSARQKPGWMEGPTGASGATTRTGDMGLSANKRAMNSALDEAGAQDWEKSLVMSMALTETSTLSPDARDQSKDGNLAAKNHGALNLNGAMVRDTLKGLGMSNFDLRQLNSTQDDGNGPEGLRASSQLLLGGIRKFGPEWAMRYQRGGESAFAGGQAVRVDPQSGAVTAGAINYQPPSQLKMEEYLNPIRQMASDILASQGSGDNMLTNGKKYNYSIPWV
jgi:hypothetical protein